MQIQDLRSVMIKLQSYFEAFSQDQHVFVNQMESYNAEWKQRDIQNNEKHKLAHGDFDIYISRAIELGLVGFGFSVNRFMDPKITPKELPRLRKVFGASVNTNTKKKVSFFLKIILVYHYNFYHLPFFLSFLDLLSL